MTSAKDLRFQDIQRLSLPLSLIKGVGPKRAELLSLKGINTILDLLYFTPIRYEDRSKITPIRFVENGSDCLVSGTVVEGREEKFYRSRKRIYRIVVLDDGVETLELIWFHYIKPHLAGFSRPGLKINVFGTMKRTGQKRQMFHPDITVQEHGNKDMQGFLPVYSAVKGISGNAMRSFMRTAMDHYLRDLIDPIPVKILDQLNLPGLRESIKGAHFPPGDSDPALLNRSETFFHRRLVFDRFFYLMLIMAFRKKVKDRITKPMFNISRTLDEDIKEFFKFSLTSDQIQAIKEISNDLMSGHPMNRMLMGDVGTGKTAVAAIAAHITVLNNRQAALMAPTQILAEQHMDYFSSLPERMGFRPVLVKGNMKKSEREDAYNKIKNIEFNLIIGTQSLIQRDLVFGDLGLAIIDEQHRFGVRQRAMMDLKGDNPHILVMTATPIPRSLAIAIYADMEMSMIKEYPGSHKPVKTCLVDKARKKWAFEMLKECMSSGHQAFVICPVIDETEDSDLKGAREMYARLKKLLCPPYRIGMIHGQMPPDERKRVMHGFYRRHIDLLVATTVIEVGVHVPNATVMIIEHPERFGLAQLHQLRGRVGRGTEQGMCLLILPDDLSEKTEARLKAIAESHDGFEIARKDLEFRGYGELTGLRQAGIGEIEPSEIIRHQDMLMDAKRLAHSLIQSDPELLNPDHRYLKVIMEAVSGAYLAP